jgi:hypothetical protein
MHFLKNHSLLLFFVLVFPITGYSQKQDKEALKTVIETFFEGMDKHDTLIMKSVMHKNSSLHSVLIQQGKLTSFVSTPMSSFYRAIAEVRPNTIMKEKILSYKFLIDQDMATVWTPYQFFLNGKVVHHGTNNFSMARLDGKWFITAIMDTRKRPLPKQ